MTPNIVEFKRARSRPSGFDAALSDSDLALLQSLADSQLRYGQAEEAFVLLRICQTFRPEDPDIMTRIARALLALEEYEAADAVLDALARAHPARGDAQWALLRAWSLWGVDRARDAFRFFDRYLTMKRREQPA